MNIWAEGGTVTFLGILIVFACLVLIILLINIMAWIMKPKKKEEPKAEVKFEEEIHKPLPEMPVVEVENNELVAVLTAAVAAYMEDAETKLVVRSYRRVSPDSAWARASRSAQIYNKV